MKITICELKFFFSHCITHTNRHIYFFVTEAEIVCILFWCSYSLHFYEFLSQTWQHWSAIYTYSAANMLGLHIRNHSTPSYSGLDLRLNKKMQLEFTLMYRLWKNHHVYIKFHMLQIVTVIQHQWYMREKERDTCRCIRRWDHANSWFNSCKGIVYICISMRLRTKIEKE